MGKTEKATDDFGKSAKKAIGVLAGLVAVGATVRDATKTIIDFGKAVSSLSAITGATGKDLEFFKQAAREIGKTTTISAVEAVKAFEVIGSAAPKLLKNKEALVEVTNQAVILAEASGLALPEAAKSLTTALNQFQLPASDASRIINVLAAGAKEGAAAIPLVAQSIEKFGTVAASSNISLEESVALVEVLASRGIEGAEAGTQLRNVILKLQAAQIGFKDGTFSLTDALKELNEKQIEGTELSKLFGLESVVAGQILKENLGTYAELTEKVTGTSVALDQQEAQLDNVGAALERVRNAWQDVALRFEEGGGIAAKALVFLADNMDRVVNTIGSLVSGLVVYKVAVRALNTSLSINVKRTFLARIAMIGYKRGLTGAARAMRTLNIATKANVIGVLIGLVTTAIGLFFTFRTELDDAADSQKEFNAAVEEGANLRLGVSDIQAQIDVIEKLDKVQLEALKRRVEQEELVNSAKAARLIALEEARADEIAKIEEENVKKVQEIRQQIEGSEDPGEIDRLTLELMNFQNEFLSVADQISLESENITKREVEQNKKRFASFKESIDAQIAVLDKAVVDAPKTMEGLGKAVSELKKQLADQAAAGEISAKTFQEFTEATEALNAAQKLLKDTLENDPIKKLRTEIAELQKESLLLEFQGKDNIDVIADLVKKMEEYEDAVKGVEDKVKEARKGGNLFLTPDEVEEEVSDIQKTLNRLRDEAPETFRSIFTEGYIPTPEEFEELEASLDLRNDLIKQKEEELRDSILDITGQITDGVLQLLNQRYDGQLEAADNASEKRLAKLEEDRDSELISESEYNNEKNRLEEQYQTERVEILRKQALAERAAAILGIAISSAQTIFEAQANAAAVPPFITLPTGVSIPNPSYPAAQAIAAQQIGFTLASAGLQTALILSEPLPQYAKGTKDAPVSGYALVGEEGPEIHYVGKGDGVLNAPRTRLFEALQNIPTVEAGMLATQLESGEVSTMESRDYSERFYRQYLATKANNSVNIRNHKALSQEIAKAVSRETNYQRWYN